MLVLLTPVVGADSYAYLNFERELRLGIWSVALGDGIHPGYPVAIALFGTFLRSPETGAYAVSVLFSSLAVLSFYVLVRDFSGRRVATLSALFMACLPYLILEHSAIMTEGFFHFWFITSMTLVWFGATRVRLPAYLWAGFTGAMAYLTRPEGIYFVGAVVGFTLLALAARALRRERVKARALGFAAVSLLLFLFLVFPLLLWFKHHSGKWTLSARSSVLLAMGSTEKVPTYYETPHWSEGLLKLGKQVTRTTLWFFLPLIVLGLIFLRGRMRPLGTIYLACLSLCYSLAPTVAAAFGYPLSHRYILVTVLYALPFAALGWSGTVDWMKRRWNPRRVSLAAACLLGLLLMGMAVRAVHPRRTEQITIKQAALWLRDHADPGFVVYSNTPKVDYYLRTRTRKTSRDKSWVRSIQLRENEYIIVQEPRYRKHAPGGLEVLEQRFRRLKQFPEVESEDLGTVSIFVR